MKENALYVCLPAERSIIYMDGDRQGGVFSPVLSSTAEHFPSATVHQFALTATLSGPSFTLPFFIASLGELAGPTINEFSVFTLVSGFLSSFSRHIYSGFTFSKSCLIFTLLTFFFCIYLFLHLSPIFTSIYLSQFCLEEEVSHFPPHF